MAINSERYELWHNWYEFTFDDAKAIAALMGIDIRDIYFSGFWSQGDGACFAGTLGYAKGCAKAVREYAPNDTELHKIADQWQALHKASFYQLTGTVKQSGHYSHEYCTSFDWEAANRHWGCDLTDSQWKAAEGMQDVARDLMRWIYRRLEKEYEFQSADMRAYAWAHTLAETMTESRQAARQLVKDMREAIKSGLSGTPSICAALRKELRNLLNNWEDARRERQELENDFYYWEDGKSYSIQEFANKYY